jgi:hypothetical protein
VNRAGRAGYEAYAVDCTSPSDVRQLDIGRFDAVLAGEIIEHVGHPGGLLDVATELIATNGDLIITTPNARRLTDAFLAAAGREVIHPDHVGIFSAQTLQALLKRHGWVIGTVAVYLNPRNSRPTEGVRERIMRLGNRVERSLVRTVSPYLADGLIVVARRAPSNGSDDV